MNWWSDWKDGHSIRVKEYGTWKHRTVLKNLLDHLRTHFGFRRRSAVNHALNSGVGKTQRRSERSAGGKKGGAQV